jgi:hypothetical protein
MGVYLAVREHRCAWSLDIDTPYSVGARPESPDEWIEGTVNG